MDETKRARPSVASYLGYMLKTPLATWWGAATFAMEVMGFLIAGPVISLSRLWLLPTVFLVSFSLFVGVLVLCKGWFLYSGLFETIRVKQVICVEGEQIFLLEGLHRFHLGSLFELHRIRESVELPIGLIAATRENEDGTIQARPVWIMPGHMRDIESNQVSAQNLTVHNTLTRDALDKWIDGEAEARVRGLIRRGQE
jgi:hypothetical protein